MKSWYQLSPAVMTACAACAEMPQDPTGSGEVTDLSAYDLQQGGRYFDKWFADLAYTGDFAPDASDTPGVADGSGGPFADGTLPGADDAPLLNEGHDYRPKNLFGWDLRGQAGVYGPGHLDKATVLPVDLLSDDRSHAELSAWFAAGGDGLPAYGDVLSTEEIDDLTAFVVAMREGQLPRGSDIWALSETAPNGYTLLPGGDPEAGHAAFAGTCAACHGADGATLLIDDGEFTLGSFARQNAYEGWLKVLVGHPGSVMGSQVPHDLDRAGQAGWILDVFAALCDRAAYPATGATEPDVADGDPRCGSYLQGEDPTPPTE